MSKFITKYSSVSDPLILRIYWKKNNDPTLEGHHVTLTKMDLV